MHTEVYALEEHANGGTDEFGTTRPDIGSPERRPTAARSKKEINEAKQLLLELGLTDCPTQPEIAIPAQDQFNLELALG